MGIPFLDGGKECRLSLLVIGNPNNPPTRSDVIDAIMDVPGNIGHKYVDSVIEQNIDTDQIDGVSDDGIIQAVIVELVRGKAFSVNSDGDELVDINDEIRKQTGAIVFMVAR